MNAQIRNNGFARVLQEAWTAWGKEIRDLRFYYGSAPALVIPALATLIVMAIPGFSIPLITVKLVLLGCLTVLSAIRYVNKRFVTLGIDFWNYLAKRFDIHLFSRTTPSITDERFSTRTIAPPKSPPRLALA